MNGLRRRLTALESPSGYATIGDMLDALEAGNEMPSDIDPRITSFFNGSDVLLDMDFDADADMALCATHIEQKGVQGSCNRA